MAYFPRENGVKYLMNTVGYPSVLRWLDDVRTQYIEEETRLQIEKYNTKKRQS